MIARSDLRLLSIVPIVILCHTAVAQSMQGSAVWQVSTDSGATWMAHADVPQGQSAVLVRLMASWSGTPAGERTILSSARFDGIVRGLDGSGAADSVSQFLAGEPLSGTIGPTVDWGIGSGGAPRGLRQGDLIKIDPSSDSDPPGMGVRWTTVQQGHPTGTDFFDLRNPIRIFQYELSLDGSPGTRTIGSTWGLLTPEGLPKIQLYHDDAVTHSWPLEVYNVPITITDASITVIPAPGILGLLGLLALPRRRR